MPVIKERLHIWAKRFFIPLCINFSMRGRKSSHPTTLPLKLHIILPISSSVTAETKKLSDFSTLIYSLGHLSMEGISLAKDNIYEKIIKFISNCFSITNYITIVFEFQVDWTIFPFINDRLYHLPRFFYVIFMLHYQVLVVLAFGRS